MLTILAAIIGAAGFRLRGSVLWSQWTGRGIGTARLVCWATPLPLLCLCVAPWLLAPLLAAGLYAGSVLPWWRSLSLGRNAVDGSWIGAAARHTARGLLWAAGPAAALWWMDGAWWLPLAAGALIVAPYEMGWRVDPTRATAIGEVGFGAMMGAAIMAAA